MQSRWFWNTWLKDFQWIWYGLLSVFILSFAFFWFNYFQGAEGVIHWDKIQEQKTLESIVHSFQIGAFELEVPADSYVILEYFNGSNIEMNIVSSVAFTIVLIFSAIMLLTVITALDRFWYFVGMVLFILFVVSLRLEVLSLFGQRNQIPSLTVLSLFILLSFYFHALNKDVPLIKRWIAFIVLAMLSSVIIYFFSWVPYPMLHLSVTGYSAGLVLSILFILMVAHEIPAAFAYLVGQGDSKSLMHFSIISVIYIVNIIITGLHELHVIQWNFIYINPYLLLSISGILGLWGFRLRENLYANIFSFEPLGAFFFLSLGTICFATIAQLLGTANDPALHIIRNVIIFSHVGYGVIFLTYIFSNFISMMANNMPVFRILYKSNRMPYFSFRLAGLIVTLCFVFYSSWHSYIYNGIAGFYNNIGDLYELLDRSAIAEAYYEQGRNYGFENNHANYALGKLKAADFNLDGGRRNYKSANGRTPTVFSLINEGNIFLWQNKFFESINVYRAGEYRMPHSGELANNLGFAYGKIHRFDSSVFYLNVARNDKHSRPLAEANFFAIAALEYFPIKCDSVLNFFENPNESTLSNAMALTTVQHQAFKTKVNVLKEKKLNLYSATLLNNYIIHNVKSLDSVFIEDANNAASDSLNSDYSEALKSSIAIAYYYQGNVTRALQVLGELAYLSQTYQGKYNYVMGLWALEQNNPKLAASYFKYAVDADYKQGRLYYAIALSEDHQEREALAAWDSLAATKDEAEKSMAAQMIKTFKTKPSDALALDDAAKYQFCRYRLKLSDTLSFNSLISTFQSDDYKAQALLDMTKRQFEGDNLVKAIRYFNRIAGLKLTDKNLYDEVQHTETLMLAGRKELRSLAKQINKGITFPPDRKLEKIYYTALLNEAAKDTVNATKNYEILAVYNPYFESGVIAAADYFRLHGKDRMKAYTILVEAIQVNNNSVKILKAYAAEALRMGFTEYAVSALQQVSELNKEMN